MSRWMQGLVKSREALTSGLRGIVGASSDELWDGIEEALISADLGVELASRVVNDVRAGPAGGRRPDASLVATAVRQRLGAMLVEGPRGLSLESRPTVMTVVGVNGVGKTTTIGKLAFSLSAAGRRVMLGACDTFRAAAGDQLSLWAERAGVDLVAQKPGADPAAVAFDALDATRARGHDVLIIDTAGRLHTKRNLMEELKKIHRVLGRAMPGAPHEVLLVLDATTGQNALAQARLFHEAVGVTGIALAKLDGTSRGGVALAVEAALGIPIKLAGLGEDVEDLQPFDPEAFLLALFPDQLPAP